MKYRLRGCYQTARLKHGKAGFTLLECTFVMAGVGILMSMAAPSYLALLQKHRLNIGQQEIYQAMRLTQSNAQQENREWEFGIRLSGNRLEWTTHPQLGSVNQSLTWNALGNSITFDLDNTTLPKRGEVYYVQFDDQGNLDSALGRVTLTSSHGGKTKRCVIVSTLLGALRQGREQPTPDANNRYCY